MAIIWHKHHLVPKYAFKNPEKYGHMIPDNMKLNDPDNVLKCNISMHAFLHKVLWEKHGNWQDRTAWKRLSGQISCAEAIKEAQINGRKLSYGLKI